MQTLSNKRLASARKQNGFGHAVESSTAENDLLPRLLGQNDGRLSFVTENISDAFFILDAELRCTYWNKGAERLTGLAPLQAIGSPIGEVLAPITGNRAVEGFFRELNLHQTRSSIFQCQTGEKILLLSITARRFTDGISAVARDITAIEQGADALHQLAAIVESSDDAIFSITREGFISSWNRAADELYGYTQEKILGKSFTVLVPPQLRREQMAIFRRVLAGERCRSEETQRLRRDGAILDVSLSISPIFDAQGVIVGASAISREISERKQAQAMREDLARRLLNAQEAERTRIARELHDGIGQSLALVNIQLQRLCERSTPAAKAPDIRELSAKLKHIGERVSQLSHQLHSSELEFLGLAAAIKGLCREFSQQYRIDVDCACRDVPADLGKDIALAMLRVTQEALHNVAKHSRAGLVRVRLTGTAEDITCTISDDGIGFDVNKAHAGAGLGLVSMRERMYLIGGQLTIAAGKHAGTTVEARAPLAKAAGVGAPTAE